MFFDAKACGASTEETEGGETRRDFGGWLRKLQSRVHVSRLLSQTQSRKEGAKNAKVWGRLFFNTEAQRHREFDVGGLKFVKPPPKSAPCLRRLQPLRACAAGLCVPSGSA